MYFCEKLWYELFNLSSSWALSIIKEPFEARLNLRIGIVGIVGIVVIIGIVGIVGIMARIGKYFAKVEPVMGRGESAPILVPGVGGRGVARGEAVQHNLPANNHPVLGRHLHPEPHLVVVGLCVIRGCSWFTSTTTSA